MRISDWSSDVCSADAVAGGDLVRPADRQSPCYADRRGGLGGGTYSRRRPDRPGNRTGRRRRDRDARPHLQPHDRAAGRSEEHTSELQSLMRISYAVFCLKKKKKTKKNNST